MHACKTYDHLNEGCRSQAFGFHNINCHKRKNKGLLQIIFFLFRFHICIKIKGSSESDKARRTFKDEKTSKFVCHAFLKLKKGPWNGWLRPVTRKKSWCPNTLHKIIASGLGTCLNVAPIFRNRKN